MSRPIQRRLYLIRHARAEEDSGRGDHARPLSPQGRVQAQQLGQWLLGRGGLEQAWCSPAVRTRETLEQLALNAPVPTLFHERIYLASMADLLALLQSSDPAITRLALVAHNPGIHQLAAHLAAADDRALEAAQLVEKYIPASCAELEFEAESWAQLAPERLKLTALFRPNIE